MKGLRRMLNDWDFIGVGEFSVHDDEYDCLIGPLLTRLASGANDDESAGHLHDRIEGHFGLEPAVLGVATFAATTVAWWNDESAGTRERSGRDVR
jgi:hypothetical protein